MSVEEHVTGHLEAEQRVAEGVDETGMRRAVRQPLAALLAEAGVATSEELRIAVAEGMSSGERLGEVVLRRGWIDETGLARLLARQWDLPFVEDEAVEIDERASAVLQIEAARELGAVPLGLTGDGAVLVAVAEPSEERFASIRQRLNRDSALVVITGTALMSGLDRLSTAHAKIRSEELRELDERSAAADDEHLDSILAELDAAGKSIGALRQRTEELTGARRRVQAELAESRRQLEALEAARAADLATVERLEREVAEQRERFTNARTALTEAARALEG